MKQCSKCKQTKDLSAFSPRKQSKDGLWGHCKSCANTKTKKWRSENPVIYSESNKKSCKKQYLKNKEDRILQVGEWRKSNPSKRKAIVKKWQQNNPGKRTASENKRRASKINATPKWADLKSIAKFYENCPKGFHVDHIVPLKGKNVSGLHVLENLQYLLAADNIKKSNKFKEL